MRKSLLTKGLLLTALATAFTTAQPLGTAQAAVNSKTLPSIPFGDTAVFSAGYILSAYAGTMQLNFSGLQPKSGAFVTVENYDTGEGIFYSYVPQDQTIDVALPQNGNYVLVIATSPNETHRMTPTVTVSAPELNLPDTYIPSPELTGVVDFERVFNPFTIRGHIKNFTYENTGKMSIALNGGILHDNIQNGDGSVQAFTFDPSQYEDGYYQMLAVSFSKTSENVGIFSRQFFIDYYPTFTDVGQDFWAYKQIESMSDLAMIDGRGNGTFDPNAPVTRQEFAKMVANAISVPEVNDAISFADVPADSWSYDYITHLSAAGLAEGEVHGGQRWYFPNRTITRAEAATMLNRALGVTPSSMDPNKFTDFNTIPNWAQPHVYNLTDSGWITGYPDGSYRPLNSLTRAEAMKILYGMTLSVF